MASVTVRTFNEDFMTCLPGQRMRDLAGGLPVGGLDVRPMLADRGEPR